MGRTNILMTTGMIHSAREEADGSYTTGCGLALPATSKTTDRNATCGQCFGARTISLEMHPTPTLPKKASERELAEMALASIMRQRPIK